MTKQEYLHNRQQLTTQYLESIAELDAEFAATKKQYKIGDLFTDEKGTIKIIEIIPVSSGNDLIYGEDPNRQGAERWTFLFNER